MNDSQIIEFCDLISELSSENDSLKQGISKAIEVLKVREINRALEIMCSLVGTETIKVESESHLSEKESSQSNNTDDSKELSFTTKDVRIQSRSFITGNLIAETMKDISVPVMDELTLSNSEESLVKKLQNEKEENSLLLSHGLLDTSKIYTLPIEHLKKELANCDKELIKLAIYYDSVMGNPKKSDLARKYGRSETFIANILNLNSYRFKEDNLTFSPLYKNWLSVESMLCLIDLSNIDTLEIKVDKLNCIKTAYLRGYSLFELEKLSPLDIDDIKKYLINERVYQDIPKMEMEELKFKIYYRLESIDTEKYNKILVEHLQSVFTRYRRLMDRNRKNTRELEVVA